MKDLDKNSTLLVPVILCILFIPFNLFAQSPAFVSISNVESLKRDKETTIRWSLGSKENEVTLELTSPKGKVQSWIELANDGEHQIKISAKIKPGKNYRFKIYCATTGEEVNTNEFIIKRKIPLGLKIASIVLAPAAVLMICNNNRNSGMHAYLAPTPSFPDK